MSSHIHWKPIGVSAQIFSVKLRDAIVNNYGHISVNGFIMDSRDLDILRGMLASGIQEAEILISAIHDKKVIIITEE